MEKRDEATQLSGENGTFRSNRENTYRAANDLEALRAWIESARRRGLTEKTLGRYTREVERFMLWSLMERKKAMSSMEPADFGAYEEFLAAPPAHWKSKATVKRMSIQWRPMRGPLLPSSIEEAMKIVRMLYHDWLIAGYLRADPTCACVSKTTTPSIHWLTTRDWQLIEAGLSAHADDIFSRRTRAAMLLMRRCCLLQQDVVSLTFESLVRIQTPIPGFAVPSRDGTLRAIDYETWAAIEAHFADRVRLIAETSLGRFENVPDAEVPVIGAVVLAGVREVALAQPINAGDFRSKPNVIGGIRQHTLARFAWQFLESIASEMSGDEATSFLSRAQTWLDNPSRQTPERRRKILVDKLLGKVTHEFVDEPKQEALEIRQIVTGRPTFI